jgi:hypothetical protein
MTTKPKCIFNIGESLINEFAKALIFDCATDFKKKKKKKKSSTQKEQNKIAKYNNLTLNGTR